MHVSKLGGQVASKSILLDIQNNSGLRQCCISPAQTREQPPKTHQYGVLHPSTHHTRAVTAQHLVALPTLLTATVMRYACLRP